MRKAISEPVIDKLCCSLINSLALDSFIEVKVGRVQKENSNRLLGIGTVSTSNWIYNGEIENGLPEGRGIYKFSSGTVYDGEVKGGKLEGRGVYKYPYGDVYDGKPKVGSQKAEEFISMLTVRSMMENLKVGSQRAEEFLSFLLGSLLCRI